MNQTKLEQSVKLFLAAIGEDVERDGLKGTPKRVAKMYMKTLSGYDEDVEPHIVTFDEDSDEMVIVKDIPFFSYCEHHIVPFIGKLHIGYIPNGTIVGISKLVRVARIFAKRLQVQERLTTQIADLLEKELKPLGVMVYIEAEHMCMTLRGVRSTGAKTVTSTIRGRFREPNNYARVEFLEAIKS